MDGKAEAILNALKEKYSEPLYLRPCPICGHEAQFTTIDGHISGIRCTYCGCELPKKESDSDKYIVYRWNFRPAVAELECELIEKGGDLARLKDEIMYMAEYVTDTVACETEMTLAQAYDAVWDALKRCHK